MRIEFFVTLITCLWASLAGAQTSDSRTAQSGSKAANPSGPLKAMGTSFITDFGSKKLTFVKVDGAWLVIHRSLKKPGKFKATSIQRLCDRRVSKKAYLSNEGLFVSVNEPGHPIVDSKDGRVILPWNITVTYEDTGNFSTQQAKLYVNKKGTLKCAHEDNR